MIDEAEGRPAVETPRELPIYLLADLSDLDHVNIEAPISDDNSADCYDLSNRFTEALKVAQSEGNGAAECVYAMLGAATNFHHRNSNRDAPYGPMSVMGNSRSAEPADFRGTPVTVLAELAVRVRHPALRARLSDICWLLDRSRNDLGVAAIEAFLDLAQGVETGAYRLRFESEGGGGLSFFTRDILNRALQIANAPSMRGRAPRDALKEFVQRLFLQAANGESFVAVQRWGDLALDFAVVEAVDIGRIAEEFARDHIEDKDYHSITSLLELAARAYQLGKDIEGASRCKILISDTLVAHASTVGTAMLSSSLLADALSALSGVQNVKDKRQAIKHTLVDAQAGIPEEMLSFSHPIELNDIVVSTENGLDVDNLRDMLFIYAFLDKSPSRERLREEAIASIREHPLTSLFAKSYHDSDGKVLHVTSAADEEAQINDKIMKEREFGI